MINAGRTYRTWSELVGAGGCRNRLAITRIQTATLKYMTGRAAWVILMGSPP